MVPGFIFTPGANSRSASFNLAEARREAQIFGEQRRKEIRRQARIYELAREQGEGRKNQPCMSVGRTVRDDWSKELLLEIRRLTAGWQVPVYPGPMVRMDQVVTTGRTEGSESLFAVSPSWWHCRPLGISSPLCQLVMLVWTAMLTNRSNPLIVACTFTFWWWVEIEAAESWIPSVFQRTLFWTTCSMGGYCQTSGILCATEPSFDRIWLPLWARTWFVETLLEL